MDVRRRDGVIDDDRLHHNVQEHDDDDDDDENDSDDDDGAPYELVPRSLTLNPNNPSSSSSDVFDVDDDVSSSTDILPSFPSLRRRTLDALYGTTPSPSSSSEEKKEGRGRIDKSPKGSVDGPIRSLVDLINAHPDYVTLSSCSGRIALFDPRPSASFSSSGRGAGVNNLDGGDGGKGDDTKKGDDRKGTTEEDDDEEDGGRGSTVVTNVEGETEAFEGVPRVEGGGGGGGATRDDSIASPDADADAGAGTGGGGGGGENKGGTISGKGRGGSWLLSSHRTIAPSDLFDALRPPPITDADGRRSGDDYDDGNDDSTTSPSPPLLFKHEPLLLHVAASSLYAARTLLTIALRLGLRESGIVTTNAPLSRRRITVAMRSYGLSLTVPLHRRTSFGVGRSGGGGGALQLPDAYLEALADEANRRFRENAARLERLEATVRTELFVRRRSKRCRPLRENDEVEEGAPGSVATTSEEIVNNEKSKSNDARRNDDIGGGGGGGNGTTTTTTFDAIVSPLPTLRLTGCAAVAVPWVGVDVSDGDDGGSEGGGGDMDCTVLVFGGRGAGPIVANEDDDDDNGVDGKYDVGGVAGNDDDDGNGNGGEGGGGGGGGKDCNEGKRLDGGAVRAVHKISRRKGRWSSSWQVEARRRRRRPRQQSRPSEETEKGGGVIGTGERNKGDDDETSCGVGSGDAATASQTADDKDKDKDNEGDETLVLDGYGKVLRAVTSYPAAVEGLAACLLPPSPFKRRSRCDGSGGGGGGDSSSRPPLHLIALFGGRTGITPHNDLHLYVHRSSEEKKKREGDSDGRPPNGFYRPTDVAGKPPCPRWGHTLTALSGRSRYHCHLAVVVGGRDVRTGDALPLDVHVLSLSVAEDVGGEGDEPSSWQLSWHRVDPGSHRTGCPMPASLFHHCAVLVSPSPLLPCKADAALSPLLSEEDEEEEESYADCIFVFGGLTHPEAILEPFSSSPSPSLSSHTDDEEDCSRRSEAALLRVRSNAGDCAHLPSCEWTSNVVASSSSLRCRMFGAAACAFSDGGGGGRSTTILVSGGIIPCDINYDGDVRGQPLQLLKWKDAAKGPRLDQCKIRRCCLVVPDAPEVGKIDFGSMVHHCAVPVPYCLSMGVDAENAREAVLIGGGAASFAFGQSFARSYHVSFQPVDEGKELAKPIIRHELKVGKHSLQRAQAGEKSSSQRQRSVVDGHQNTCVADVVYVTRRNAKMLKIALERHTFLDRRYRMQKATETAPVKDVSEYVAVPVTDKCRSAMFAGSVDESQYPWVALVAGVGTQKVPYSTAVLGNRMKR